jgi:hypothetical protein
MPVRMMNVRAVRVLVFQSVVPVFVTVRSTHFSVMEMAVM